MAWIEHARNRYRVRFRHAGMTYTDSTFTNRAMAEERLNTLGGGIRRRAALFEPGPAPLLKQWVPIWMNSRLVYFFRAGLSAAIRSGLGGFQAVTRRAAGDVLATKMRPSPPKVHRPAPARASAA